MSELTVAMGMVAPYYNMLFVLIAVGLFIILFRTRNDTVFMKPWYLFFVCLMLFVCEEVLTIVRAAGYLQFIPQFTNAFWELGIITIFIYIALIQREYVRKELFDI